MLRHRRAAAGSYAKTRFLQPVIASRRVSAVGLRRRDPSQAVSGMSVRRPILPCAIMCRDGLF